MATTLKACNHPWNKNVLDLTETLVVTDEMWTRLEEIYPDADRTEDYNDDFWETQNTSKISRKYFIYATQVFDAFEHMTDEKRAELDEKILKGDFSGLHLQVLLDDYKGYVHLNQVASHVKSILKVYDNPYVMSYCNKYGLFRNHLEVHDLSKVNVAEIFAFTYRYVLCFCEVQCKCTFKTGPALHCDSNCHHPQYWGKENMSPDSLMESVLDRVSCRLERYFKSDPTTTLADLFTITDEHPDNLFFSRYNDHDVEMAKKHLSVFQTMKVPVGAVRTGTMWDLVPY
jgi:hypothetical protein